MSPAIRNSLLATLICAAITALATPLIGRFDLANIVMLFLLAVMVIALYLGRGPAIWAAFLSVACFDFFFVPPRFAFGVDDPQYLVTFAVMLAVALAIGHLTAGLGRLSQSAARRTRSAHALNILAAKLAGVTTADEATAAVQASLREGFDAHAALIIPGADGVLPIHADGMQVLPLMASLALDGTACTDLDAPSPTMYLPMAAGGKVRGVLAVVSPAASAAPLHENKDFLETVASLAAMALERVLREQRNTNGA